MSQLILGNFFNAKNFTDSTKGLIKSSLYQKTDFIAQGYKPKTGGDGVLYSWHNVPLAYYDIPTLNNMVFSKHLWESIHENEFIKAAMENKAFWGEAQHRDDSEVKLENVAIRVNDFRCIDNNLVVGDVDLMDTPSGLICYSLAKTGMIGNSSRGYGDLIDRCDGSGLSDVDEDNYLAVDWDLVGFPAVPNCMVMSTSDQLVDTAYQASQSLGSIVEQLRNSVKDCHEQNPENELLSKMFELFESYNGKHEKVFPMTSSIKFRERKSTFPKNVSFKRK